MSAQFGQFPVEPLFLCSAHKNAALNPFFEKDQSPLLGVLQLLCFTCHSSDFMHAWFIRDQRLSLNVKQCSICQPASMSALLLTGNFSRFRSLFFSFLAFCKFQGWDRLQHLITFEMEEDKTTYNRQTSMQNFNIVITKVSDNLSL